MTNRKQTRTALIAIILIAAIFLGSSILPAIIGGIYDDTVDIHELASVSAEAQSTAYSTVDLTQSGQTVNIRDSSGEWTPTTIQARIIFQRQSENTYDFWYPPDDNFRAEFIVDGTIFDTSQPRLLRTNDYLFEFTNMGAITQGSHQAYIQFRGLYTGIDVWSDYYDAWVPSTYDTQLIGTTATFTLTNDYIATPDPITLTTTTTPFTMEADETKPITWTYKYLGELMAQVSDNTTILETKILPISTSPTTYTYDYSPIRSGPHEISLTLSTRDGLGNPPITKSLIVNVLVGGERSLFPPSLDTMTIRISQLIQDQDPITLFEVDWWSNTARSGQSAAFTKGEILVECIITPSTAFSQMWIVFMLNEQNSSFTMTQNGNVWSATINTDQMEEGMYTVVPIAIDATDVWDYEIGTFYMPIRVQPMIDPMLIGMGIIGIVFIALILRMRRR